MSCFKKYYIPIALLTVALVLAAIVLGGATIETNGYSVENVYDTIVELSSDKYRGRRFGTEENMDAVRYIEEQFRNIGIKPAGEGNTFLRSYSVVAKKINGFPVLEVVDKQGDIVKSYKLAEDFNDRGTGLSCTGEITSGFSFVSYPYGLKDKIFGTDKEIAVMHTLSSQGADQELYMKLKKAGCKALIKFVPDNYDNIERTFSSVGRKPLTKSGYELPTLYLRDNLKEEIIKYSSLGYKMHIKTTTEGVSARISDVMGMIPGKTDDYLFITAHLDHVGTSPDGRIYPGAFDNASGTAAMLELARYIKSQNKKPNKNIVFIAFNGEEGGWLGSANYVREPLYPLNKTTVINLDMIGAGKDVPIRAMYTTAKGINNRKPVSINAASKLRYQMKSLALELGIPYTEQNAYSSDHAPFNFYGVAAITILDNDTSKIHTTKDDISNIGKENIARDMRLVMNFVSYFAYSNGGIIGNKLMLLDVKSFIETQYPLILGIIAALILLLAAYKTKIFDSLKIKNKIPVLTIVLIILMTGVISYFPIRYPYAPTVSSKDAAGLFTAGIFSIIKTPLFYPFYVLYIMPGIIVFAVAKNKQLRWNYKGDGKELDMFFNISMFLTVILALVGNLLLFGKEVYYVITPDFTHSFFGKLLFHIIIGGIAYLFWRVQRFETKVTNKGYKSLISYALIFIILLYSFYMPIALNKYVISSNSSAQAILEGIESIE